MDKQDSRTAVEAELQAGRIDPALWSRAQELAGGDAEKLRQTYIRLRQVARRLEAAGTPPPDDALTVLRSELGGLCTARGRRSHYTLLGLTPEAEPPAVAAACERGQARRAALPAGQLRSELDAALQALATPATRADYDRRLHAELSAPPPRTSPPPWRRPPLLLAATTALLVLGGMQFAGGERRAGPVADPGPQAPATAAVPTPEPTLSAAEIEAEIARNQKLAAEGTPEDRPSRLSNSSSAALPLDQRLAAEADARERDARRALENAARQQEAAERREDAEARQRTEAIRREGFTRAIRERDFNHALKLAGNAQEITFVEQAQRRWVEQEIASARQAEEQKGFEQAVLAARQRRLTRP